MAARLPAGDGAAALANRAPTMYAVMTRFARATGRVAPERRLQDAGDPATDTNPPTKKSTHFDGLHRPGKLFIVIGRGLLFGTMVLYFVGLLLVLSQLLAGLYFLHDGSRFGTAVAAVLVLVLVYYLYRWGRQFVVGILALVTALYDDVPEARLGLEISPSRADGLHRLVAEVCARVGTTPPDTTRVVPWPVCYTVEQRRFALRTRRRNTLVLGAPQIAVLRAAGLRVIVAHEMAHLRAADTTHQVFVFRFLSEVHRELTQGAPRVLRWLDPSYWVLGASFRIVRRLAGAVDHHQELEADRVSAAVCGGQLAAATLVDDLLLGQMFSYVVEEWNRKGSAEALIGGDTIYGELARRWTRLDHAARAQFVDRVTEADTRDPPTAGPSVGERMRAMLEFPPIDGPACEAGSVPARELIANFGQLEWECQRLLAVGEPALSEQLALAVQAPNGTPS